MGTISANKLAGYSLVVGPIVTLLGYFLQPGGMLIDAADPADAAASLAAITSNDMMSQLTGVVIALGLIVFLYGFFVLQSNMRENGSGDAVSRYGVMLLMFGVIGWVVSVGMNMSIAGSDLTVASQGAAAGALYSATLGINTIAGLLAGLGFLLLALAISTRDDQNKIFALVAAAVGVVVVIAVLIGGMDTAQLQNMQMIIGICYLIHVAWTVTLGLGLMKQG